MFGLHLRKLGKFVLEGCSDECTLVHSFFFDNAIDDAIVSWVVSEKSNRIPVAMFHGSLRVSGMDVSSEEAECLVANMIYKGYMRGYISHEKQMVVLANTKAFPGLAERPTPYTLH